MANNFLQFSMAVEMSAEERAWCQRALRFCETWAMLDGPQPDVLPAFARAVACMRECCGDLGFSFGEYYDEGLIFFTEESGDPEALGEFLSAFLAQWRPDAEVSFTWADTCSKMRPDEFSGGSVVVTAREVVALGASTAADALLDIRAILWPAGDADHEWSADELPEIASRLMDAGLGPKGAA